MELHSIFPLKVKVRVLVSQLCLTLCDPTDYTVHGFSRPEYWSGLPCPPPGDLPNPGIEPASPILQADSLSSEPPGKPHLSFRVCYISPNFNVFKVLSCCGVSQNFILHFKFYCMYTPFFLSIPSAIEIWIVSTFVYCQ